MQHAQVQHEMEVTEAALGMVATAASRDAKIHAKNGKDKSDV